MPEICHLSGSDIPRGTGNIVLKILEFGAFSILALFFHLSPQKLGFPTLMKINFSGLSTCSLAGCHGNQTKDISPISTFLKFTNSLLMACKTLGSLGKGFRKKKGVVSTPPPRQGCGYKTAWHGKG